MVSIVHIIGKIDGSPYFYSVVLSLYNLVIWILCRISNPYHHLVFAYKRYILFLASLLSPLSSKPSFLNQEIY